MEEAHLTDEEKLKKISKQLKGSAKIHGEQAEDIDDIVDRSDDEELKEGVGVVVAIPLVKPMEESPRIVFL